MEAGVWNQYVEEKKKRGDYENPALGYEKKNQSVFPAENKPLYEIARLDFQKHMCYDFCQIRQTQ